MANILPASERVGIPNNSLLTESPEEDRQLAMMIARHTIYQIRPDSDVLKEGRKEYETNLHLLTEAGKVVALEFQIIAVANDY